MIPKHSSVSKQCIELVLYTIVFCSICDVYRNKHFNPTVKCENYLEIDAVPNYYCLQTHFFLHFVKLVILFFVLFCSNGHDNNHTEQCSLIPVQF